MSSFRADLPGVTDPARCPRLRRDATDAERCLWRRLRGGRLRGYKFRRQHEFGLYVLDFFCPARRLVIEANGGQHSPLDGVKSDAARARFVGAHGLRILRLSDREILLEPAGVEERIVRRLSGRDSCEADRGAD